MLSIVNRSKYGSCNTSAHNVKINDAGGATGSPRKSRRSSKNVHVAFASSDDDSSPVSCSRKYADPVQLSPINSSDSFSSPRRSSMKRPGTPNTILSTPVTSHDGDLLSLCSSSTSSSLISDEAPLVWPVPVRISFSDSAVPNCESSNGSYPNADQASKISGSSRSVDGSHKDGTDRRTKLSPRRLKWPWKKRHSSAPSSIEVGPGTPTLSPTTPHPASPFSSFRASSTSHQSSPYSPTPKNTSTSSIDYIVQTDTLDDAPTDHDSALRPSSQCSDSSVSSSLPAIVSPAYKFTPIGYGESDNEEEDYDTDTEEEDDDADGEDDEEEEEKKYGDLLISDEIIAKTKHDPPPRHSDNNLLSSDEAIVITDSSPFPHNPDQKDSQQIQHRELQIIDTNEIGEYDSSIMQKQSSSQTYHEQPGCCVQEDWSFMDLPLLFSKCVCSWSQTDDIPDYAATTNDGYP
uniref:Uncharacterized protein n=1 Tax=Ditylum brightwellii TaxID=49249 RepID=A0A7S1ZGE5_9STRA|mmetsp:Transcript_31370/g.46836  ORF Transcript_31370/g.46836 Transcript_31370/m.46836 type:complete len:461 (+) Transcript_31370:146-1528(+)